MQAFWIAAVWLITSGDQAPLGIVGNLVGCVILAFFWQQDGWLSHDFLHYSGNFKRGAWMVGACLSSSIEG